MTLVLEPNTPSDYRLFVSLAKRLNVKYRRTEAKNGKTAKHKHQKDDSFFALAGSLDLPETADELIESIEKSRVNKEMDISWTQ